MMEIFFSPEETPTTETAPTTITEPTPTPSEPTPTPPPTTGEEHLDQKLHILIQTEYPTHFDYEMKMILEPTQTL